MNPKRISTIVLSLLLVIATISIAYAAIADSAKMEITLISQEPDPVEPGGLLDLRFKVENKGGGGVDNLIFEIIPENPFSLYKGEAQRNIGSMQAYQEGEEGIIVHYELKIDENAIEGENYIDIRYKTDDLGTIWQYIKDFPVRIRTEDIILSIESITTNPEIVSPGKEFDLALTVKNNADSLTKDIKLKLDLSDEDTPFAPSTSTAEKQIYQLNSKTGKIINFNLIALPDADGGIYKIPINMTYSDETGEEFSKDEIISLKITSIPDLLVSVDNSEIVKKQKSGEIIIKIVNRGLTNIKLVSATLKETDDYEVTTQSEVYVGNIDSDDYETVEYKLNVKSYDKIVKLPLQISYRDSTNKQYQEEIILDLKTYSPSRVSAIFSGLFSILFWLAVIGGAGYLGYRFYKKRKSKRKG